MENLKIQGTEGYNIEGDIRKDRFTHYTPGNEGRGNRSEHS